METQKDVEKKAAEADKEVPPPSPPLSSTPFEPCTSGSNLIVYFANVSRCVSSCPLEISCKVLICVLRYSNGVWLTRPTSRTAVSWAGRRYALND